MSALLTAQEPPVLRTETRAVQINVGVKDRDGLPIRGLQKEDFSVFDDGKLQPIQFFSPDTEAPAGAPQTASGRAPVTAYRLIALVLDGLNTEFTDQSYMHDQALAAVRQMQANETVAVLTLVPGLPFQPFTRSRERLLAAIDAFRPNLPPYAMKRRIQVTLAALTTLSGQMKQGPGRKSIVWMTGGFPDIRAYDRAVQRTMDRINASNVALYPIDVRGLTVGSGVANIRMMERFADATGGEALYNRNDIAAAIEEAVGDARSTYVLGFYLGAENRDSKFHELTVRVNHAGAVLHYRRGYANQ